MSQNEKIKQILAKELKQIEHLKKQVEKSLRKAPEGNLVISKSNGVFQYFHKTEKEQKKGKYIAKKNGKLIAALAQKEYDVSFQREVEKLERKIERVIRNIPGKELEEVYENLTEARKPYVAPHVLSDEEYAKQWLNVQYIGKIYKDEFPRYTTKRGEMVRSKSEKIVADLMYTLGIPYRYEYPLYTKGYGTIYPDFMILKISTREEIYLEFFGMMDNPEYCEKAVARIQELARNGLILGKNLFAIFESQKTPIDTELVEKMLMEFL